MKRILIIGCPGSGKSTLSRVLSKKLDLPILHLDRIFHIDNTHQISRDELRVKIQEFVEGHDYFIIDGNYTATLSFRMQYADTIIFLDFPTETCLTNIIERTKPGVIRDDMAPGFDNTIVDPEFVEFVSSFRENRLPRIYNMIKEFNGKVIIIKTYDEMNSFLKSID